MYLLDLEELLDFSESHDVSATLLGLDGVLGVLLVLKPDDVLQQGRRALVQLRRQRVVAVPRQGFHL